MAVANREVLKEVAKEVRAYLKETGGTFSVRVQSNDVVWISGAYAFGVDYSVRGQREAEFSSWLEKLAEERGLECHNGMVHRYLK